MSETCEYGEIDVIQSVVFQRENLQVQRQIELIDRFETIVIEVELAQMIEMDEKREMPLRHQFVVAQIQDFELRRDQFEDVLVDRFDT